MSGAQVPTVMLDERRYPDPKSALAAYMLMDGYSAAEVQAYFDYWDAK